MSVETHMIDKSIIKSLYPLSLIAEHLLDKLFEHIQVDLPASGQTILKASLEPEAAYYYLIEGEIEHRLSFEERRSIGCADALSGNPLHELLKEGGSLKAGPACQILTVDISVVDEFLSWSQNQEFKVVHMDDDNSSSDYAAIDDNYEDDWSDVFLKSPLAAGIPAATMLQLFSAIEDFDVKEGDEIIKENSPGDYFYIIKHGLAKVLTNPWGPFKGANFDLSAGDYFGDEALVADTTRNATVVMSSNGQLGRLSKDQFEQIIKLPLMTEINTEQIAAIPEDQVCYLDVRLAAEYRHQHYDKAKNYPIAYIRKHLQSFDMAMHYVITPGCGRRGELAVYLLKQAGYKVFLIKE